MERHVAALGIYMYRKGAGCVRPFDSDEFIGQGLCHFAGQYGVPLAMLQPHVQVPQRLGTLDVQATRISLHSGEKMGCACRPGPMLRRPPWRSRR